MYYVYQLRSLKDPSLKYTGYTQDIKSRLSGHNRGNVPHTSKNKPWELINYFAFSDMNKAKDFENYLKTGSGRSFAKRHFWE